MPQLAMVDRGANGFDPVKGDVRGEGWVKSVSPGRQPAAWRSLSDDLEVTRRCSLCGGANLRLLFEATDTLHGLPGKWGIVRCDACGLMFTSPRPTRTAIKRFYPEDYQPFTSPHSTPPAFWKRVLKPVVNLLLDPKEHILPPHESPGTALEVGCGSGRFLVHLAELGWKVEGFDPSANTIENLRQQTGLPLRVGTIESMSFNPGSFDLIAASMVLEHLHDPLADARRLRDWLRAGGYLMGSVPNCASWEFRFFGPEWYALQVPTHLFHFTSGTLCLLLKSAGFQSVKVFHQRNVNNLMVHLGWWLKRRHLPGARSFLEFPERGSIALRYAVRPVASILAWARQAGRISFLARR